MSLIYGCFHVNSLNFEEEVETLKEDLKRYPTDEYDSLKNDNCSLGLFSIRLRKFPFPQNKIIEDKKEQTVLIADARLDYRDELLKKLEIEGKELLHISDPELIMRSFKKWGKKCVHFLEGDFCFLLYDKLSKRVWGARDPIGFRPFFFVQNDKALFFSSSIRGLLNLKLYDHEPNEDFWANRLLKLECLPTATPHEKLYQLPIGHEISIDEKGFRSTAYFKWKKSSIGKEKKERELGLKTAIEAAVRSRFYPDYEIGCQLSGGLDSSTVTAMVSMMIKEIDKLRKVWTVSSVAARGQKHHRDERPWVDLFQKNFTNISTHFVGFDGNSDYKKEHQHIFSYIRFRRYDSFAIEEEFFNHLNNNNCKTVLTGWRGDHFVSRHSIYSINDLLIRGNWYNLLKNFRRIIKWRGFSSFNVLKRLIKSNAPFPLPVRGALPLLNKQWIIKNRSALNKLKNKEGRWKLRGTYWDMERFLPTDDQQLSFYMEDISFLYKKPIYVLHPLSDVRVIRYALNFKGIDMEEEGRDRAIFRNAMKGIIPEEIRLRNQKGFYNYNEIKQLRYLLPIFLKENKHMIANSPFVKFIDLERVLKEVVSFCEIPTAKMEEKLVLSLNILGYLLYFAKQETIDYDQGK